MDKHEVVYSDSILDEMMAQEDPDWQLQHLQRYSFPFRMRSLWRRAVIHTGEEGGAVVDEFSRASIDSVKVLFLVAVQSVHKSKITIHKLTVVLIANPFEILE